MRTVPSIPPDWLLYGAITLAVLIALVGLRPLLWWLFSFEKRLQKILEQKKSSEVRLGRVTESLAPLLEDFPVDIHKPGTSTVFIGQPIDFIHFDPDTGISFIEVKSGEAKLSPSQKKLKELVAAGKISWLDFKVRGK